MKCILHYMPLKYPSIPSRVRAYGPGVEPSGPVVGAPANFTVETFSAGKGEVTSTVESPNGESIPVRFFLLASTEF